MQNKSLGEIATLLAARDRRRLVDDCAGYAGGKRINENASCDAEDLAKRFDEDAVAKAKLATEQRRVEATA